MPLSSWYNPNAVGGGVAALESYELRQSTPNTILFRGVAPQAFFWLLAIFSILAFAKLALERGAKSFVELTPTRRLNVLTYVVELVFTTPALIVTLMYGLPLLLTPLNRDNGSLTEFQSNKIDDWNNHLSWTKAFDNGSIIAGYAVLPVCLLYVVEVILWAVAGSLRVKMVAHHLLPIVTFIAISRGGTLCLDLGVTKIGLTLFLHIVTEQPIFMALLAHRFDLHKRGLRLDILFYAVSVYIFFLRLLLTCCSLYLYIEVCWLRTVTTDWARFYRWFLPPIMLVLFLVQMSVITIYISLAKRYSKMRAKQDDISQADNCPDQSTSSDMHDIERSERIILGSTPTLERNSRQDSTLPNDYQYHTSSQILSSIAVAVASMAVIASIIFPEPFQCSAVGVRSGRTVAIVGAGVAGLTVAQRLARDTSQNVILFEEGSALGGSAKAFCADGECIEMGLKSFKNYANFDLLLESLNVSSSKLWVDATATLSVHSDAPDGPVIATGGIGLPLQKPNLAQKFSHDMSRFALLLQDAGESYDEQRLMTETLGQFLELNKFSDEFVGVYVASCMSFYLASKVSLFDMPIALAIFIETRFGICLSFGHVGVWTIRNGTKPYLDAWEREMALLSEQVDVRLKQTVVKVNPRSNSEGPTVHLLDGSKIEVDAVVLACGLKCMQRVTDHDGSSARVRKLLLLAAAEETQIDAHRSVGRLEAALKSESCSYAGLYNSHVGLKSSTGRFDFLFNNLLASKDATKCADVNTLAIATRAIQQIDQSVPDSVFKNASEVLYSWRTYHTSHDVNFFLVGRNLHKLQGHGSIFYAGGDVGLNLHEMAHISGIATAQMLGAKYPNQLHSKAGRDFMFWKSWFAFGNNVFTVDRLAKES